MTDKQYLKQMIALSEELERAAAAWPYDPVAYNDVVRRLNSLTPPWQQRRWRRPSFMLFFIALLLCFLAWLILEIVL